MNKNWLLKMYRQAPLGWKVAIPVAAVVLVIGIMKTFSLFIKLALVGLAIYLIASLVLHFRGNKSQE